MLQVLCGYKQDANLGYALIKWMIQLVSALEGCPWCNVWDADAFSAFKP